MFAVRPWIFRSYYIVTNQWVTARGGVTMLDHDWQRPPATAERPALRRPRACLRPPRPARGGRRATMTCVRADASRLDHEDRARERSVLDLRGGELDLAGVVPALERLVARWRPSQVWLFGSRARGEATAESDWDLLVVVPDATPDDDLDPLVGWQIRKESRVRADLIPCRERLPRRSQHPEHARPRGRPPRRADL
ncbi:nucleotidyltransferase domain-containing protein [Nannocystis pusilla]|uniref:nucleotidyltransferase domain-containing protein n=1 Tax=Nannocystis pusilla TaxID=889268 RepID=UPI003B8173D1